MRTSHYHIGRNRQLNLPKCHKLTLDLFSVMIGGHFCVTFGLRVPENWGSSGLKQTQQISWDLNADPTAPMPMLVSTVLLGSSASDLLTNVSAGSLPAGAAQLPNSRHGRSTHRLLSVGTTGDGFPKVPSLLATLPLPSPPPGSGLPSPSTCLIKARETFFPGSVEDATVTSQSRGRGGEEP